MTPEERMIASAQWDARTPLERLQSLTHQEQSAFLALWYGGRTELQWAWSANTEKLHRPSFGKAECEWPDISLWTCKLPGLRLTTYTEGERLPALGMAPGSVFWRAHITITQDGYEAREAMLATRQQEQSDV